MSTNAYDSTTGQLDLVAGTPRSRLNAIQVKAEASLNNQSSSIEPSNTAQYSHTAGSFINYGADKQFAEVTSAIAVGDSIVNGTNVEDKSIGEVLTSLNSALKRNVLWKNSNPSVSFSETTINLNDNLSNYNYIEVYCVLANNHTDMLNVHAKYPIENFTRWDIMAENPLLHYRIVTKVSDNQLKISSCYKVTTYNGSNVLDPTLIIPYEIIGCNN